MKLRAVILMGFLLSIFGLSVAASVSAHQGEGLNFVHHPTHHTVTHH